MSRTLKGLLALIVIQALTQLHVGTTLAQMTEDYPSIIEYPITIYQTDQISADMDALTAKFPDVTKKEQIGESELGRPIYALVVGNTSLPKSSTRKLLVFGNMHARELQSAPLLMKQAEYYLENWENEFEGQLVKDIFKDSAIYFVPTTNPDGNEIVHDGLRLAEMCPHNDCWDGGETMAGSNLSDEENAVLVDKIKTAITNKFTYDFNYGFDVDDKSPFYTITRDRTSNAPSTEPYERTIVYHKTGTVVHYKRYSNVTELDNATHLTDADKEIMASMGVRYDVRSPKMYSPDYVFKDIDLVAWRSNVNGVDLHLNFWEDGVNALDLQACAEANSRGLYNNPGYRGCGLNVPATRRVNGRIAPNFYAGGFTGTEGLSESEARAIRNFIENNGLYEYAISYHSNITTVIWDYTSGWGRSGSVLNDPELGARHETFRAIATQVSQITSLPTQDSTGFNLGFLGWYQQKYKGMGMNIEVGWNRFDVDDPSAVLQRKSLLTGMFFNDGALPIDAIPVSEAQLPLIWESQKHVPLTIIKQFANTDALPRIYAPTPAPYHADLSDLSIEHGTILPAFDPGIVEYEVQTSDDATSIRISAAAFSPSATIALGDQAYGSEVTLSLPVSGDGGASPVEILVTSGDGTNEKTYRLWIR